MQRYGHMGQYSRDDLQGPGGAILKSWMGGKSEKMMFGKALFGMEILESKKKLLRPGGSSLFIY